MSFNCSLGCPPVSRNHFCSAWQTFSKVRSTVISYGTFSNEIVFENFNLNKDIRTGEAYNGAHIFVLFTACKSMRPLSAGAQGHATRLKKKSCELRCEKILYVHMYIYTYIYIYTHIYMYVCKQMCKHIYTNICTCICIHVNVQGYIYIRVCIYMYLYICMLLYKKQGDKWGNTKGRGRHMRFQDAMRILGFQSTL